MEGVVILPLGHGCRLLVRRLAACLIDLEHVGGLEMRGVDR